MPYLVIYQKDSINQHYVYLCHPEERYINYHLGKRVEPSRKAKYYFTKEEVDGLFEANHWGEPHNSRFSIEFIPPEVEEFSPIQRAINI